MKPKKNHRKVTYVLVGTLLGSLSLLGFGYWYFKGRKGVEVKNTDKDLFHKLSTQHQTDSATSNSATETPIVYTPVPNANTKNSFPLQQGNKNALVKQMQEALIKNFGKNILPKHGANGSFGTELADVLKSKGFPATIDKETFDSIVAGAAPSATPNQKSLSLKQAIDVAKNIWLNANLKKLTDMTTQLRRMHTIHDYKTVNILFRTIRTFGEKQDIANAVFSAFSKDETSKQILTQEFQRIGLKYDGEKWNLSGILHKGIITTQATIINNGSGTFIEVPKGTVLGEFVSSTGWRTKFRTIDNQTLYVPTKHVSQL